jgi:hypothetical protein
VFDEDAGVPARWRCSRRIAARRSQAMHRSSNFACQRCSFAVRQWGACRLAGQLWQELQLDRFWADRLRPSRKKTRWDQILQVLAAYRLIAPGSEWRLHRQWFGNSGMADLLGLRRHPPEPLPARQRQSLLATSRLLRQPVGKGPSVGASPGPRSLAFRLRPMSDTFTIEGTLWRACSTARHHFRRQAGRVYFHPGWASRPALAPARHRQGAELASRLAVPTGQRPGTCFRLMAHDCRRAVPEGSPPLASLRRLARNFAESLLPGRRAGGAPLADLRTASHLCPPRHSATARQ